MRRVLLILIFILLCTASITEGKSGNWELIDKYSVTDFDKEGNNIYIGDDGYFYIDKIEMSNKELIISKFDKKKRLIDVIRVGLIYDETEKNQYFRRNENIAIFFDKQFMYLFNPGSKRNKTLFEIIKIDLDNKEKEKVQNLEGIDYCSIFGILIDSYYYNDYDYAKYKNIYPISLMENGEIVKGMLTEEEMEGLANNIGYTIREGWTLYRGFHRSALYVDGGGNAWLSKDLWKAGGKLEDDTAYESAIFGLEKEKGEWKVTEFIHPFNFPELRYNVFIDRIIKTEGNKLWLWVRIGHNITGTYEDNYFDREIWVIEKK